DASNHPPFAPSGGRQRGNLNITTVLVKEAISQTAHALGGLEGRRPLTVGFASESGIPATWDSREKPAFAASRLSGGLHGRGLIDLVDGALKPRVKFGVAHRAPEVLGERA